ncbi:MAG: hypothetical protein SH847_15325 [Roseiflexaceae bacterium]|nr:hypothetical protein [Roseiflexaceae bacterium]
MSTNRGAHLLRHFPLPLLCAALVAALGLLWKVRRIPIALPFVYADALAAFVIATLCAGLVLAYVARSDWPSPVVLRVLGIATLATAACLCAIPIASAILLFAVLALAVAPYIRRPVAAMPLLISGSAALVAAFALTLRGVLRYDDPAAGVALDSLVFWFTLLAAVVPALPLTVPDDATDDPWGNVARILCIYPLARLFTLGPWNEGWSLAAMLLGGGAACWAALAALTRATPPARMIAAQRFFLGLALGALGLASSAGVAASCYALLCYALVCTTPPAGNRPRWASWVFTGALPLSAPFMASWLAIGAAAASGAIVLAGVLWLAALLRGVALLLEQPTDGDRASSKLFGRVYIAVGVLAPPIVAYAIQPIVDQLQGGLTPYGNLSIAPWVGLALLNSGSQAITTAPTLAAAGLMLVLVALVFLLSRLFARHDQSVTETHETVQMAGLDRATLIADLVRAVPWLRSLGRQKGRDHDAR